MARIITTRGELLEGLTELVGFKAGLTLTPEDVRSHIPGADALLGGDPDEGVTLRAEEYEQLALQLLHRVGHIDSSDIISPVFKFVRRNAMNERAPIVKDIQESLWKQIGKQIADQRAGAPIDFTPVLDEMRRKHGTKGLALALGYYKAMQAHVQRSPWSASRRIEWREEAELR